VTVRIHQLTAALVYGDAITNHTLEIDARLKDWRLDSRVYAQNIEPRMRKTGSAVFAYEPFLAEPDDWLIYHYSVYSPDLGLFERSANRRIVIYHNITPPEFFRGFDQRLEAACQSGRWALSKLRSCDLALADSDFNRRELVEAGFTEDTTSVLPIFLNLDSLTNTRRNEKLYRRLSGSSTTNFLFVGRVVPNKGFENLIKIFYYYHRYIDPQSHLWLVGVSSLPVYEELLRSLIAELDLENAVTLTGRVSLAELRTYYEAADLFLCASHHEGFCVPLLESMHFDLPILAYNRTAVPETLGGSGVLFDQFRYAEIAEAARLLITDAELRKQVIHRQRRRLADFGPDRIEETLRRILVRLGVLA
jgi:glycosyltransferase involved in cell wall biosynthesis